MGGGGACAACALIWKNAIAAIKMPIHIRRKPIAIMVRTAPINISSPAVPNKPAPVFEESRLRDLLKKNAARMANTKSTTRMTTRAVIRVMKVLDAKFMSWAMSSDDTVVGSKLAKFAKSMPKSAKIETNATTAVPIAATTPTIAAITAYRALLNMPPVW